MNAAVRNGSRLRSFIREKAGLKFLLCHLWAIAGFVLILLLAGGMVRPDMSTRPEPYGEEALREAVANRTISIDQDNPLVLYREVDYSEGKEAAWYPKGESPVLAELVEEGRFPPVEERVGDEPAVVEGMEGVGRYGGTWYRVANSLADVAVMGHRMSSTTLVRWSPQGYPIVPHVAKHFEVSPDVREFTFTLRKGMKWSDGHPFTADDIMFWWEHDVTDPMVTGIVPAFMVVNGKRGDIEKINEYKIKVTFPEPNGLFLPKIAGPDGMRMVLTPAHYLKRYHPRIGEKKLIEAEMQARNLHSPVALYKSMHEPDDLGTVVTQNPGYPRLWPWIYQTYRANPPYVFVRNPYYWMVDTHGNQLPYVDRVVVDVKTRDMIGVVAANGEISMQARHMRYPWYTLLMSQREKSGFEVRHWYPADRSIYVVHANLNRKVEPDDPATAKKHALLNEKRFRQALSLAINREEVIAAEFSGQTEPAQTAPGPASPFYEPAAYSSYTEYDPDKTNQLLDGLGLTQRDYEGYRTFGDGSRMTFYLNYSVFREGDIAQFLVDYWKEVGVRVIPRERSRSLYFIQKRALLHDFTVSTANSEYIPILDPRVFVPHGTLSDFAIGYGKWYQRGGLYGDPRANAPGCLEPPEGHPVRRTMEIYDRTRTVGAPKQQKEIFREAMLIAAENVWTINVSTPPPVLAVVKDGFCNVPRNVVSGWEFLTPGNAGMETYFWKEHNDSPGVVAQVKEALAKVTPRPRAIPALETMTGAAESGGGDAALAPLIRVLVLSIVVFLILLVAMKHPYVGKRLAIMAPTLLIISVAVFTIIQLPPGDYVTSRIMELEQSGDSVDAQALEDLRETFFLNEPVVKRYGRWLGLMWFKTFEGKDRGLLQGHLGRSMENGQSVNDIVGDRIRLTLLISLGTILFAWATALPIGIYSAVRQYSLSDYLLTFVGFIGMCVPPFLLALVLMYLSSEYMGIKVTGLFSSRYAAQPEWTWGKVVDLMQHIWVPVVVLGVRGTAEMIRIMRANLLDELKKPYVITAMAKGVRPLKLLFKYPVRIALNPFISGIGALFPQMVSGGAIVAMVLSLPTVGPLMLDALLSEDMYLAGSLLMVLSLLGVFGTLVSDLLLLWLDPRIRFQGGSR